MYIKKLNREYIFNWLCEANENIVIYSPWISYFGTQILFDLFQINRELKFEIYFRFNHLDILQGFVDLIGLNDLKREGCNIKFFENKDLHAKIYIIDNKRVISGSCNFTEKGFGSNLEIAIESEFTSDFRKIIDNWSFQQINQLQINSMLAEVKELQNKYPNSIPDIEEFNQDLKFKIYSLGLR